MLDTDDLTGRKTGDNKAVAIPCMAYQKMQEHWAYVDMVLSGETADSMAYFLPQEYIETDRAYQRRCNHAAEAFVPWFKRLTDGAVGQILRRPVDVEDSAIDEQLDNIDLQDNDLNVFIRPVLRDAIAYGKTHLFCEYPTADGIERLDQQIEAGLRPYWVHYDHAAVIGWRTQQINGRVMLSQVRIKCHEVREDGEFGEKSVNCIKVYDLIGGVCQYREFEQSEENWILSDLRIIPLPYIPIAPYYTNRTGIMTAIPAMEEIAKLNIQHFRKVADLDHSLHIAAHPKLMFFGCDPDKVVDMAADRALIIEEADAKALWLAAPSDSFVSQVSRIQAIEQQISSVGMSIINPTKNSAETAQSKMIDRAQGDSMLAVAALGLQDTIDTMLGYHLDYINPSKIGSNVAPECEVNRDFDPTVLDAQLAKMFADMQQVNQITLKTLWKVLGDALPDDFDASEELEELGYMADDSLIEDEVPDV
jgi:hypothetical protein